MAPAPKLAPHPTDLLRPPSADSTGTGAVMSLLAHAVLVAALALGVQWRTQEPVGVEAELWAAVPESAAPPAPVVEPEPPTPQPPVETRQPPPDTAAQAQAERDAEIATEQAEKLEKERREAEDKRARERREQAERDKRRDQKARQEAEEAELAKQKLAEQKKLAAQTKAEQQRLDKADEARREKLRQDQLRRMNAQLDGTGSPGSTGSASRDAGPSANYAGRIKSRIKPNIVLTDSVVGNPSAEVEVRVAPDGSIIGRRLVKASGSREWDEAVLRAIDRTGMLPRDTDGRVPSLMVIAFKRDE